MTLRSITSTVRDIVVGAPPLTVVAAAVLASESADARPVSAAQNTAQNAAENKAIISTAFEAWAAGAGSPFDLLADDARWTIEGNSVASKTYPTKADFLREVIRPFNARMASPLRPTVRSLHADGDMVIAFFDARGTARDGQPYVNTYAWFLDMRSGRIIRASAFFDAIAFNDLWSRVEPARAN